MVILFMRLFLSTDIWRHLFFVILPVVVVLIFKQLINDICSRFIFLNRKSKLLAIDNFRAFNIFLYFNFYFDCFMGFISAFIRLIKAVVSALMMLPSKLLTFFESLNHQFKYLNNRRNKLFVLGQTCWKDGPRLWNLFGFHSYWSK